MAGSVRIDIVAQAQDKATATMKKVSSGLNQVGKDTKSLGSEQKKATGVMGKMQAAFGSVTGVLGKAVAGLAAFGLAVQGLRAVGDIVGSVVGLSTELAALGDNIAKTAPRVGLNVEEFQRLDYALQINGSSMEQQKGAFVRFARTIDDASLGVKTAVDAMQRLGIQTKDTTGLFKPMGQLVNEAADAFSGMRDGVDKTALAAVLFGRKGTDMLQFLNQGSEGLRALSAEADTLGNVLSEQTTQRAEEATDAMLRFDTATAGVKNRLGDIFLPVLTEAANKLAFLVAALNDAKQTAQEYGVELATGVTKEQEKGAKAADEFVASLERLSKEGRSNAEVEEALAKARAEGGEALDLARRFANKYFTEAQQYAEEYYNTQNLGAEVDALSAQGKERVAEGVRDSNDALDSAIRAIKEARAEEALQIDLARVHVAVIGGATLNTLALAAAQREFAAATKEGSRASAEQIQVLASSVETAAIAVTDEKKRTKKGGGGGGMTLRKMNAELEKVRLTQQGYATARNAATAADRAGIALETKLMQITAQRESQQVTARQATVARAQAQMAYVQARDKAIQVDTKAASQRADAAISAAAAAEAHKVDLELMQLERKALDDLTDVERASLDLARERLEVKREEILLTGTTIEQARAMALAAERVATAEKAVDQAVEGQNLEEHAQQFADINTVMQSSAGMLSSVSQETAAVAASFGDAATAAALWGDSEESKAAAVDSGVAAGQKMVGGLVKDEKTKAAILGAMEVARAAAAFATGNIPGGAAHLASAALFGAVAGGAIKSGGSGGGRSASGTAATGQGFKPTGGRDEGGGQQQVIVTFGDGIILGSPGQVGKAVAEATGALSGTGMASAGSY